MIDPVELGKQMAAIVREATSPLVERIAELEKALSDSPAPAAPEIDVVEIAKAAAEMIPAPKAGKSVTADDVRPLLAELVKHVNLPAPPSVDEVAAVFERRFSDLTLSWERQARDTFEKAADRMPVPKDGRDALPLESFDLSLGDDDRTVTVKMQAGETVIEKSIKLATVLDRGPYKSDGKYEKGDGVSHGGCFWIAQKDNPDGVPGMGASDFRLAVKKGNNGKDLRDNASSRDPSKGVPIK